MAKKETKEPKTVKVIKLVQEGSAYGYQICEVDDSALKLVEKTEPEVLYIFVRQLESKVRDLFGL